MIAEGQEAFRAVLRLTSTFFVTMMLAAIVNIFPYGYTNDARPDSIVSAIPGRLLGLIVMIGMPGTLENLLAVVRTGDRRRPSLIARLFGWLIVVALVLAQLLPLREDGAFTVSDGVVPFGVLGAILAFVLGIRSGWIINLRKRQKWGLLGTSTLGLLAAAGMLIVLEQSPMTLALVSQGGALAALAYTGALSLLCWYMVIFVTALFALPTADAIDRRNAEVSRMATLARLLTQSLDSEDLIDAAVAIARDATSADTAWIEIGTDRGPGGIQVRYGSQRSIPAATARSIMEAPAQGSTTLRGAVVDKRRLEVVDNISGVHRNGTSGPVLRSAAGAPLLLGDRLVGALYLAKERTHGFDRDDVNVLTPLADQIALALEHSQLIRDSLERERFEQEMLIAKDLQQRLLPRIMPRSPFYELHAESTPASIVGGDYYDVVAFSDQTIGLLVADVSGKGASAALYMGVIKGIIQALSGIHPTPRELLARANVALHGSIDQRWFVTMTCAQILETERRLRIARAGHCPPLLVRRGVGTYSRPKGIGLAIARPRLFEANLELEEIQFESGDYVVFMSDGLPEARSPDGDEFGYDRLRAVVETGARLKLSPVGVRDHIFKEIDLFCQGEQRHDDSTLVVLQWT